MKRITLVSLLILIAAPFASAQDWAKAALEKSSRHREWVTVKHGGRSVETFVVYPESAGRNPRVLIIHENFGMTDWVEDLGGQGAWGGVLFGWAPRFSRVGPERGRRR